MQDRLAFADISVDAALRNGRTSSLQAAIAVRIASGMRRVAFVAEVELATRPNIRVPYRGHVATNVDVVGYVVTPEKFKHTPPDVVDIQLEDDKVDDAPDEDEDLLVSAPRTTEVACGSSTAPTPTVRFPARVSSPLFHTARKTRPREVLSLHLRRRGTVDPLTTNDSALSATLSQSTSPLTLGIHLATSMRQPSVRSPPPPYIDDIQDNDDIELMLCNGSVLGYNDDVPLPP